MRNISSKLFSITRKFQRARLFHTSGFMRDGAYDGPGKTTISVLNVYDEHRLLIQECSPLGFHLNNETLVIGPIALFAKSLLGWNVASGKDIDEASLSLFLALEPKLDLLLLGLEEHYDYKEILRMQEITKKACIPVEILPVHQACATYNFMACEGRYVAAGLVPPKMKYINSVKSKIKQEKDTKPSPKVLEPPKHKKSS